MLELEHKIIIVKRCRDAGRIDGLDAGQHLQIISNRGLIRQPRDQRFDSGTRKCRHILCNFINVAGTKAVICGNPA